MTAELMKANTDKINRHCVLIETQQGIMCVDCITKSKSSTSGEADLSLGQAQIKAP